MAPRKNRESYQFKVVLRGISPPIWRQFRVWEDATLAQLHRILQMVMGWENYHLYEFRIRGRKYGDPDLDDAEANHAKNKMLREQVHDLCDRIEATLNKYTDEATIN